MQRDLHQEEIWAHLQKSPELFWGAETRLSFLLQRVTNQISNPAGTILNIGSGNGHFELIARVRFPNVISVDPDPGIIGKLREEGIDARVGTVGALPLPSTAVDAVVASEVIEHLLPDVMQTGFGEIRRVLRPGGLFLGTVPFNENLVAGTVYCPTCHQSFHRWGHRQSFTVESLKSELSEYFSVLKVRPIYFAPWKLLNWKGKTTAAVILALSKLGFHGQSANIFFECAEPEET